MSRADIHQFGWPNSELIMPISRVNRPQSGGWFDYTETETQSEKCFRGKAGLPDNPGLGKLE